MNKTSLVLSTAWKYCLTNFNAYFRGRNECKYYICLYFHVLYNYRCPPSQDLSIVVEIQATSVVSQRLTTRGWAKFDLFDGQQRVISGRWKIPIRVAPVQPALSSTETNTVPQVHILVLFSSAFLYII